MADTTTNTPNATEQAANYTLEISRQEFSGVTFTQGSEEKGATPNDLIGELPGGEKFVLADYLVLVKATDGALPPPLTLNDGTVIDGAEVLAALGDINLDLVGDTAAGGQTGPNATGNAGFSVYFPEGLGDNLLHGPYAPDPGDLGAGDEGNLLFGQQTLGTLDIEVLTDVEISGYEDAQPNQHIGDYTLALMKVNIAMTPSNEATYRDSLTLNDIPDGAVLYVGGTDAANIVTVVGGSYTIELLTLSETDQEALLDSVYMIAPDDSDVDYPLTAEAVFGGPTGDLAVPADTTVIIDAVADMPVDLDAGFASSELLVNGDFETGDLSGWRVDFINGGSTDGFYIDDADAQTPFSGFPSAGPASGGFYAVGDQTGPSAQAIEQTFDVPAGATQVMFSADLFLNNHAGGYVVGTGLDPNSGQNQYARIDILAEGSAPFDTTVDVIHSIIIDEDSDLLEDPVTGYAHYEVDISAYVTPGESYDIRFSAVQTDFHMNFGLDNVSIKAAGASGTNALVDSTVVPPSNPAEPASSEPNPSTLDLTISAVFDDVEDGSEAHLIFARVPEGFTAVDGSAGYQGVITVNGDGTISYDDGSGIVTFAANMAELAAELRGTPLIGEAFDGTVPEDQAINLPQGVYAAFELTAAEMTSNADAAMSPSYTANVTVTLQAPDRWDMEEGPDGWQVVGGDIGFDAEDLDGEPGDDSGVMIDDTGVVEFSVPTWALAVDIPTEPDTELTYENNISLVEAGIVDVTVDPVHGQLYVDDSEGFEDGDSGDQIDTEADLQDARVPVADAPSVDYVNTTGVDEGPIPVNIDIEVPDNEVVLSVVLSNVPAGATLFDSTHPAGVTVAVTGDVDLVALGLDYEDLSILPPDDSDVDLEFHVTATLADPDTGHTLVREGDISIKVDAVAEEAVLVDQNDATAFSYVYNEDQSEDDAGDTTAWGSGETGWTDQPTDGDNYIDGEPVYGIGFKATVSDVDQGADTPADITDDQGSEYIEKIVIDPVSAGDVFGTDAFKAYIDGVELSDGATVSVRAQYLDAGGVLQSGLVDATVVLKDGAAVSSDAFVLLFDAADHVQRVDMTDGLDGPGLQITMPQHSDNDVTFDAKVWTREVPTDGEITDQNDAAVVKATITLEVQAVADGAVINTTAQDVDHIEDGTSIIADHGADATESNLYVPVDFTAELVDQDGSEGVTQIVITLNGAEAGARFVDGVTHTDLGAQITLSGVIYDVDVTGQTVTLNLAAGQSGIAVGQDIDLSGLVAVEFPIDDSTDFSTTFTVTTTELDTEGVALSGAETYTTTKTVDHVIEGVVGEADTFFDFDLPQDDGGTIILPEDGTYTIASHGADAGETPLSINVAYRAIVQDIDEVAVIGDDTQQSESITQIELSHDGDGSFNIGGLGVGDTVLVSGYTATIAALTATSATLTFAAADMVDSIDLSGVVSVDLPIDDSTDFTLTAVTTTTEYDDDTGMSQTTTK
ncbi:MAG: hypothetical protein RPU63_11605, partial [Candidatus Sedimenticola sp. (ex Thyasira tokunagai)]